MSFTSSSRPTFLIAGQYLSWFLLSDGCFYPSDRSPTCPLDSVIGKLIAGRILTRISTLEQTGHQVAGLRTKRLPDHMLRIFSEKYHYQAARFSLREKKSAQQAILSFRMAASNNKLTTRLKTNKRIQVDRRTVAAYSR